ncbi:PEP-CTERM sorting domain-containing protein [Roseisolibacter sp. H3M3-2]|uniref:PEP-CTERM sorting domain-containing protein n=1 Tax=Roseisolibacter sp. H3M3-2 TaxID=3031323 RepID=UPI0023DBA551|nr:PEP-CTERM sorting domain-containing protein [Roseisolibacter sp. H3M3-2]MDF1505627.1 PEP-CTERM sorting domain-containing protein [Roseisolibacter sp. H3M3-2]
MQGLRKGLRSGALLAALAAAAPASAQTVVNDGLYLFSPTPTGQTGGGLGNQVTILTLLNQGQQTTTQGCVTPGGIGTQATCGFVDDDVQQGQSQTQFIAGLTGETVRLGFNATEPNNELATNLEALQLTLYSNNTALARFNLASPATLTNTLNGIGNFGFQFALTEQAISVFNSFLGQSNLSLGVGARVSGVAGGPETFNLAAGTPQNGGGGAGSVVPEPSTYVLMGTGLLGLAGFARRRTRKS